MAANLQRRRHGAKPARYRPAKQVKRGQELTSKDDQKVKQAAELRVEEVRG